MERLPTPAERLAAEGGSLYAVLDAARDPAVLEMVEACPEEHESLYEGEQAEELAEVAPGLVRIPAGSSFLTDLLAASWGKSWGIFLTCEKPLAEVRRHLRHFLRVEFEGEGVVLFRFYDPRVLRVFLPTCSAAQAGELFGPIATFAIESKDGMGLLTVRRDASGAVQTARTPVGAAT